MPRRWVGRTVPSAGYAAIACPPEQASQSVCTASADVGRQQLASLRFVESAPDAVGFTDLDGVVEAGALHAAVDADLLGPGFAPELVLFPFELRRREEHGGMWSAARGLQLPVLVGLY